MKSLITSLIALLFSLTAICQKYETIYYDADWKVITDKSKAKFYRKTEDSKLIKGHFTVKDFYIDNKIQMEAELSSLKPEINDGPTKYYYRNGNLNTSRNFKQGKETGPYKEWYPNSKLKVEGKIENDDKVGTWKYYYSNGNLRTKGSYINNLKDGDWTIHTLSEKTYLKFTYKKDVLVKTSFMDASEGYYQVLTDLKEGDKDESLTPFIDYQKKSEFIATHQLIKKNIEYLKKSHDMESYDLIAMYTLLWVSNNPNLGKFDVHANAFMIDLTTNKTKMSQEYLVGLAIYKFENSGINNWDKAHLAATKHLLKRYNVSKQKNQGKSNLFLDKLTQINNEGKLSKYIRNYE